MLNEDDKKLEDWADLFVVKSWFFLPILGVLIALIVVYEQTWIVLPLVLVIFIYVARRI